MAEIIKPDLCVIGAGSGGLSVAAAAAAFGVPVVLIEKGRMGGDCLNTGCVPSKALIASARAAALARGGARFGLEPQEPRFRFEDVMDRVRERRARIAPHDSQERFESLGVDVFRGRARWEWGNTLSIAATVSIRSSSEYQAPRGC